MPSTKRSFPPGVRSPHARDQKLGSVLENKEATFSSVFTDTLFLMEMRELFWFGKLGCVPPKLDVSDGWLMDDPELLGRTLLDDMLRPILTEVPDKSLAFALLDPHIFSQALQVRMRVQSTKACGWGLSWLCAHNRTRDSAVYSHREICFEERSGAVPYSPFPSSGIWISSTSFTISLSFKQKVRQEKLPFDVVSFDVVSIGIKFFNAPLDHPLHHFFCCCVCWAFKDSGFVLREIRGVSWFFVIFCVCPPVTGLSVISVAPPNKLHGKNPSSLGETLLARFTPVRQEKSHQK